MQHGFRTDFDAIKTKFPFADDSRSIAEWSTGVVDGQCRILAALAIVAFCAELELDDAQVEPLHGVLGTFRYLRCSYEHFEHPGYHYLNSLRFWAAKHITKSQALTCSFISLA